MRGIEQTPSAKDQGKGATTSMSPSMAFSSSFAIFPQE
jgi:hypothetical protein